MQNIVVYEVQGGRMCISDRVENKYLPNTMSKWETDVRWDFRYFGNISKPTTFEVANPFGWS